MDGLRTCIGTRTCLSVSVPSGPLSLHPVRAPLAARPAPCVLGTAHTVDESEESKNKSHMIYTELKLPLILGASRMSLHVYGVHFLELVNNVLH